MEYRHLKFFIAVAEELSFTRAAVRLRVAQPHLSREIRRLEGELDVPLFARDRRRVTLTAGGSAFFEHACRILEQTAEAAHTAQRAHIVARRGGSASVFGLLPHAVRRFRQSGECDRRRSAAKRFYGAKRLTLRRIVKPRVQVQVSLCISETLPLSEPAIAVYDVLFELVQGSIESNQVRGIRQVISKHHKNAASARQHVAYVDQSCHS